jgi:RecA/RadA recombinase
MKRTLKNNLKKQIKKHSQAPIIKKEEHINKQDLVPTGCALLDLAMSGTIHGGTKKGTMINIIGESHGGKTILALTSFAETNMKTSFNEYIFIHDDVERANAFNMKKYFGEKTSERIIPPRPDKEEKYSLTIQHFHCNVLHWLQKNIPFLYVLDSFDALDSIDDQKKIQEMADAFEKDKQIAGTYGMSKAKASSSLLRSIVGDLNNTKSVMYIISQVRDNVDSFSFQKETRSGGRALKFYAFHEIWLKPIKAIKKNEVVIGHTVRAKITKNKITGKNREIEFDIYDDYGIDDIGSCINYLLKMGKWNGGGNKKIDTRGDLDLEIPIMRPKLINYIEENDLVWELKLIVQEVWKNHESSLQLNRKRRYE